MLHMAPPSDRRKCTDCALCGDRGPLTAWRHPPHISLCPRGRGSSTS
ncbi:hypothetical protein CGRA01v4_11944 [Colletotrichum graminicola]|nr:hypothetical protein CGRA01v4_11944 [Colletotrichum graminicola]